MNYDTGEKIKVGDHVLIEHGKTKGIIKSIIETQDDMKNWGIEGCGLLIESAPFGLVFWPEEDKLDCVKFLNNS